MPSAIYLERWKAEGRCLMCGRDRDMQGERCSRCMVQLTLSDAKRRAKKKGVSYSLTIGWVMENTPQHCPCCNVRMERGGNRSTSPSIDRRDNLLGYTSENCWIICFACNEAKSNSPDPFSLMEQAQRMICVAQKWQHVIPANT